MSHHLLIVESPAKAKTIKKYLGADYTVLASYGHVRDLLPKQGAVDTEHDFAMQYVLIDKNKKHIDAIVDAMKKADDLYLATDPDREGEAIAWHIHYILQERKALKNKSVHRVVFHEITKQAIKAAIQAPREISKELVNAQQARRALDYLVGFQLSPLLWKKIRYGLSAGRVQSPALRLIVEREEEIERFITQEYWNLEASLFAKTQAFAARLTHVDGEKLEQFTIKDGASAEALKARLLQEANGELHVSKIERKQRKRHPSAPFITSTLQQEAARKLGFAVQRTMRFAQQLYEGVALESGLQGLITYMRTDSVHLSQEAVLDIRGFIAERYGKDHVPEEERHYKTKAKNAQEAHEAIRPTQITRTPESVRAFLTDEQYKLYDLIWKRTIASQMISATIDTLSIDFIVKGQTHAFRASGSTIADPGFMRVYQEGMDDDKDELEGSPLLPQLEVGESVPLQELICRQHFTEPPPRFSEASLIKLLEEHGIGRPSTYASIVSTLQTRQYAILENKRFRPTDIGRIVNKFLTQYFTRYVDYGFTAQLEDSLDDISRGEKEWVPLLKDFFGPFQSQVTLINDTVKKKDVTQELLDEACPKCGKPLSVRLGKRDKFIGCTGYPDCDYTRAMHEDQNETPTADEEVIVDRECPDCGGQLKIKHGRYGKFIGCSQYPKCKHIESLNKPHDTGVECPECKEGHLVKRQSRRGKIFYSCSRYPDCKYAIWNEPIAKTCPKCAWPIMTVKVTKRYGTEWVCPRETCKHKEKAES